MRTGKITGLAAVFLLVTFFVFVGGRTGILLGSSLLFLGISGGMYYSLLPKELPCTLHFPMTGRKCQKIQGGFVVNQPGRLPIFYGCAYGTIRNQMTGDQTDFSLTIHLMGREEGIAPMELHSEFLGVLEIMVERIELFGLFGMGRKCLPVSVKKEVMILPDTEELFLDLSAQKEYTGEGEMVIFSNRGFDATLYHGVRQYREGDSLRRIHWKMTGKAEEYMVKELGEPATYLPMLFLETTVDKNEPVYLDRLMEKYISVSQWLAEQKIAHVLCWKDGKTGDWNCQPIENLSQLDGCFSLLLCTGFRKGNRKTLFAAVERWEQYPWWVCVMSSAEEEKDVEQISEMERLLYGERTIQFINTY